MTGFKIRPASELNPETLVNQQEGKDESTGKAKKVTGELLLNSFRQTIQDSVTPKLNHKYSNGWTHAGAEEFTTWDELQEAVSENEKFNVDYTRDVKDVSFSYTPQGLMVNIGGVGQFALDPNNYSQVWSQLGLKTDFHKIAESDDEIMILDRIVQNRMNAFAEGWNKRDNKPKQLFLRCRQKTGHHPQCRAVLSGMYASIPHSQSVSILRQLLQDQGLIVGFRQERYCNGESDYLRFNVMLPDSVKVLDHDKSGSEYASMITLCNHEAGGGSWFMNCGLARRICANGLIIGHEVVSELRKVHKGVVEFSELATNMETLLRGSLEYSQIAVENFGRLLDEPYAIPVEPERMIAAVGQRIGLSVPERKGVYGALYAEEFDNPTAGDVVNAITRFAGSEIVHSEQRRWQIEDSIGETVDGWLKDRKHFDADLHTAEAYKIDSELNRILNASLAV